MKTIETKTPVVLTVIPCPVKKGYSIKHNQPIGWKGIVSYWFAWYKYKSDAVKAANKLQMEYNKAAMQTYKSIWDIENK